jgi:transmembrane sensor
MNMDQENEEELLRQERTCYAERTRRRIAARDTEAAYRKVQQRIRRRSIRRIVVVASPMAASFIGAVFLTWFLIQPFSPNQAEAPLITISSRPGMQISFTLPDSTVVYLNSGSSLTYPQAFRNKERQVKLNGEAYFHVTHHPEHPFVVKLRNDNMRVRVLGTSFNIQSYNDEPTIQTTLVSGKVEVEFINSRNTWSYCTLKPGDKASYEVDQHTVHIRTVQTICETAWKDNMLVFQNTSMADVLTELSHYYNVHFTVTSPIINSYSFTGTFIGRQLSQVLDYLCLSSDIGYEIHRQTNDDSEMQHYTEVTLNQLSKKPEKR